MVKSESYFYMTGCMFSGGTANCVRFRTDPAHCDRKKCYLLNNDNFDDNPRISFCKQVNIGKKVIPVSQYDSSIPITIA